MTKNLKSNHIGRHVVKQGPRRTVRDQAVRCDKSASGTKRSSGTKPSTLNIIQFNICGLSNKKVELAQLLNSKNIHVALIQETLHRNTDPHITGYTHYPCKCTGCRGIITYIRNDQYGKVDFLTNAHPVELQKISITHNNKQFTIFNIYNPPQNEFSCEYLTQTEFHRTILAGDFNGHSPRWGYDRNNKTGDSIEDLCGSTNLIVLQNSNSTPTLFHRAHKTLSRPDLTIISADLMNKQTVEVLDSLGSSDHRPILTKIDNGNQKMFKRKTRWNFKKANWDLYKKTSDQLLKEIKATDVHSLTEKITEAILSAALISIPRGCRKKYKPFWSRDIQEKVDARETARTNFEKDPIPTNRTLFNKKCAETKLTINTAKHDKWSNTCADLDLTRGGAKAWALFNNLSGDNRRTNPKPISTKDGEIAEDQKKAEVLNKYFASVNRASKRTEEDKEKLQELKSLERRQGENNPMFEKPFTKTELRNALKKLKSRKSPGQDKIHNEMLTKLGDEGQDTILELINLSWYTGQLPKIWRSATLTPILKKGKNAEEVNSYRPISLTSCLGKLAERMVNHRLYWWLETSGLLNNTQAGFRKGNRTEDQLFRLSQRVIDGLQSKKHTTAVFIDLQQAYDKVWRKGLFLKMARLGIHGRLYKWIKSFLSDRTIQTKINNGISSKEVLEEGLPQGSSLSCILFLVYINDLPDILETEKALYADDLVIWHTSQHPIISARRLNDDLTRLTKYCEDWKLKINCQKTVYSIFTNSSKVAKQSLIIKCNNEPLQRELNPTYLGVKLDRKFNLNEYMKQLEEKSKTRLNLLKRLASTTWGADKNTLRQLYLSYIRSLLDQNSSLQSISSEAAKKSLDKVQNQALRFISGALRSTPTAACEIHTNIEPLRLRREAAVVESIERYKRQDNSHPIPTLINNWQPTKRIKRTSVLDKAETLREKFHLPDNREMLSPFDCESPPYSQQELPEINSQLVEKDITKRNTDIVQLMSTAQKTIDKYPDSFIHVYTDGSAFKGTMNAGYGSNIQYPDQTRDELFDSCGLNCSNFEAEALAIEVSLHHLTNVFELTPEKKSDIVVFSDAKSVLQSLEHGKKENSYIRSLSRTITEFKIAHQVKITLQWIPGHTNIPGNEKADKLAKQGSLLEQKTSNFNYHSQASRSSGT